MLFNIDNAVLSFSVVRGFLGRCEYKRRLNKARQEAMRLQHLLETVQNLSIELSNHQKTALLNDEKIPKGMFIVKNLIQLQLTFLIKHN